MPRPSQPPPFTGSSRPRKPSLSKHVVLGLQELRELAQAEVTRRYKDRVRHRGLKRALRFLDELCDWHERSGKYRPLGGLR